MTRTLTVYGQIERQGWPMVEALRTFRLTEQEAEDLFRGIEWLGSNLPGLRKQFWGEQPSG